MIEQPTAQKNAEVPVPVAVPAVSDTVAIELPPTHYIAELNDRKTQDDTVEKIISLPMAIEKTGPDIVTEAKTSTHSATIQDKSEFKVLELAEEISDVGVASSAPVQKVQELPNVDTAFESDEIKTLEPVHSPIAKTFQDFATATLMLNRTVNNLPNETPEQPAELTVEPEQSSSLIENGVNSELPSLIEVEAASTDLEQLYTEIFEESPDLLELARHDLGIDIEMPTSIEEEVIDSEQSIDEVAVPPVEALKIMEDSDNSEIYDAVEHEIVAQVVSDIHIKVYELEPALMPKVEEVFVELKDVLEEIVILEAAIDALPDDTEVHITKIVRELLIILEIDHDDAKLAHIVNALIVQRVAAHKIIEAQQTNDEGTHEVLDFVGSFFYRFKRILEPVYTKLGRAVLSASAA